MRIVRLMTLLCGLLWLPASLMAAAPVVAKLEYRGGLLPKRADIRLTDSVQISPFAGQPRLLWTLRAGDTLKQPAPPAERLIRFYRANGNESETICTVIVKYVADGSGWRPTFQLLQQPLVAFDGKRLVPLAGTDNPRPMRQLDALQSPARDGFYRELVFGYTDAESTIDGWEVQ